MNPSKSEPFTMEKRVDRTIQPPVYEGKVDDSDKSLTSTPPIDYDRRVYCAAILEADGRVWTGHRHADCIKTIVQATGVKPVRGKQGFVTCSGRFVDRTEAAWLAVYSGQVQERTLPFELFSEDLY